MKSLKTNNSKNIPLGKISIDAAIVFLAELYKYYSVKKHYIPVKRETWKNKARNLQDNLSEYTREEIKEAVKLVFKGEIKHELSTFGADISPSIISSLMGKWREYKDQNKAKGLSLQSRKSREIPVPPLPIDEKIRIRTEHLKTIKELYNSYLKSGAIPNIRLLWLYANTLHEWGFCEKYTSPNEQEKDRILEEIRNSQQIDEKFRKEILFKKQDHTEIQDRARTAKATTLLKHAFNSIAAEKHDLDKIIESDINEYKNSLITQNK